MTFSIENVRILFSSRYLASDLKLTDSLPPKVEVELPLELKAGATSVEVSFRAADDIGLRSVTFFDHQHDSVVGGRALKDREQTFREMLPVRRLEPGEIKLEALVTDSGGNLTRAVATAKVRM